MRAVSRAFEKHYCGKDYRRENLANKRRALTVQRMRDELCSDSSPFRLSNAKGREIVIAQDGRVAKKCLEDVMLKARETSEHIFRIGVGAQIRQLRRHAREGEKMAKRVRLETFTHGTPAKKPKTRTSTVQERRVEELSKIITRYFAGKIVGAGQLYGRDCREEEEGPHHGVRNAASNGT